MNTFEHNVAIPAQALKQLKENWGWFLLLGASLVALGTLAIIFAYSTTIFSVMYLGIFLAVIGLIEGIQSFKISQWSSFFLHLFLGILYCVGGVLIVAYPTTNAVSLTLLLAIFFIVSGILKTIFPFLRHIPHKGWLVFNGIISILLGVLILLQWPVSGLWVIGTFVGIDAIFSGWTLIMLSLRAKKIK